MDRISREKRSWNMSRIRSTDAQPELRVRSHFFGRGLRYRVANRLPGKPDMVLKKYGAVVFVHGCFWHGHEACRETHVPKTNTEYWSKKLQLNRARDGRGQAELRRLGYRVFIVWECDCSRVDRLDEIIDEIRSGANV